MALHNNNCMNQVTAIKLSLHEFAHIAAGYPLRSSVDALPDGDVAVIQMANVDPESGVDWHRARRITLPSAREDNFLQQGDVIFTTRGTRNFALLISDATTQAVCSPHFFVIRVTDPRVAPAFLAWQLNQSSAQAYFQRSATGTDILNIRREVLERMKIAVPSLAVQQAICGLDQAVRLERKVHAALIQNRQRQLQAIATKLNLTEHST